MQSFTGLGGLRLFCQSWRPEGEPRAALIIAHGYAEHSGRYEHVARHFAELGYAVYALDHRGHGQSDLVEGVRADVLHFEDYLADFKTFLDRVKSLETGRRVFLVGHSMGGAIATLTAARHGAEVDGLITSSVGILDVCQYFPVLGALKLCGVSPLRSLLMRIGAALVGPQRPVIRVPVEGLSRDPDVVARYMSDPLVYTGRMRARMGVQLLHAADLIAAESPAIASPALILHGAADRMVDPSKSQMLYDRVSSPDKQLRFYDHLYHEIFNEPERERVFADMAEWLASQPS